MCGSVVYIYCILYLEALLLIYIVYFISKGNLSGNRCSLRAVHSTLTETILDRLQEAINERVHIDNLWPYDVETLVLARDHEVKIGKLFGIPGAVSWSLLRWAKDSAVTWSIPRWVTTDEYSSVFNDPYSDG